MYFFFHLLTGIILGFVMSDLLKDRRWFLACTIGAVLPDLIDKPLSYFLSPAASGYGRGYTHSLLVVVMILILGLVFWKYMKEPGILGLGVGIISHQVLDQMWLEPSNWYYPLLGPFRGLIIEDYSWVMFLQEIRNPFEVVLGGFLALVFLSLSLIHI